MLTKLLWIHLTARTVKMVKLHHRAKFIEIFQTVAKMWRFFDFCRWRPYAILDMFRLIDTIHDDYLAVFMTVQNLIEIDTVVSTMWTFYYILRVSLESEY